MDVSASGRKPSSVSTLEKQEGHWEARVQEHRKEVDSITGIFTRTEKTRAASITNLQSQIMFAMRIM